MTAGVRVAVDAMGGDHGPSVMVAGAAIALTRRPDAHFLFFGREPEIAPLLAGHTALAARSSVHHTDVAVRMEDKPPCAPGGGPLRCGWRSRR